ncbi:MAG: Nif3-like dinuclear metal center hexameric protein [Oscillospiraceae bacterium]|nr:Nif3-like dinuclear metal center hexameric protein [Oscillospiraceae bacterium]
MTTVNDILNFLETIAPTYMKMDWDTVGLLCGRRDKEVKTVFVALDPFESVCYEAAQNNADLLITHHPLIFEATNCVTADTDFGRSVLLLAQQDISLVNAHTNLDCAPGGVNDVLAECLGLQNISVITPQGVDTEGRPWGLLRQGTVETQPLLSFLSHVKTRLDCPGLRYADGGKQVCRVAVGGGSCGSELQHVAAAGCDTYITADVKYNQFWQAKSLDINLIDAGHFYTENPICKVLAQRLKATFPEIQVILSQKHTDCAKFF